MTAEEDVPVKRAAGFIELACEFLGAAERLDLGARKPSMVTYFLLGHALELLFKSVLIAHGTSERKLRSIGHNLEDAWESAARAAPPDVIKLESKDLRALRCLNHWYSAKAFEYIVPGFMSLPVPTYLHTLATRLLKSIKPHVENLVSEWLRRKRGA